MISDFTDLIPNTRAFLADLAQDNSKAFFDANRTRYNSTLKAPAEHLAALISGALQAQTGAPITAKLFRPNRDIRFSKDKRPYNEHLHLSWSEGAPRMSAPVFFFGISLDYITAGYGVFAFQGEGLTKYRQMIDTDGDALTAATKSLGQGFSSHGPPPLKRVPAPYAKDHPHGELLKRKGLTIDLDLAPALIVPGSDPLTEVATAFARFEPIAKVFRAHLT